MENVIASNSLVQDLLVALRDRLNVGHSCRLFSNNVQPTPAFSLPDFAEASFPGYARWNLNAQFGPASKVRDGEYLMGSVLHTFSCVGPSTSTAYGWYIVEGARVLFSSRLAFPVPLGPAVDVTIQVSIEEFAAAIL